MLCVISQNLILNRGFSENSVTYFVYFGLQKSLRNYLKEEIILLAFKLNTCGSWSDSTEVWAFALHIADRGLIPGIPNHPLSTARNDP